MGENYSIGNMRPQTTHLTPKTHSGLKADKKLAILVTEVKKKDALFVVLIKSVEIYYIVQ